MNYHIINRKIAVIIIQSHHNRHNLGNPNDILNILSFYDCMGLFIIICLKLVFNHIYIIFTTF